MKSIIIFQFAIIFSCFIVYLIFEYHPTKQRLIDFFRLNRFTKRYHQRAEDIQWSDVITLLLDDFSKKYGEPKEEVFDSPVYHRNGYNIRFETFSYLDETRNAQSVRQIHIFVFLKGKVFKICSRLSNLSEPISVDCLTDDNFKYDSNSIYCYVLRNLL